MADVFLSYKKEERAKAEEVVAALRAAGFSVWWDEDLTPRTSWDAEIEREIAVAKAVLVLWSTKSVQEHSFVRREAGYALDHKKLVPAFLERCTLPLRFRDVQTVDLSQWDRRDLAHSEWRRALSWLVPLIGRSATPAPQSAAPAEAMPYIVTATGRGRTNDTPATRVRTAPPRRLVLAAAIAVFGALALSVAPRFIAPNVADPARTESAANEATPGGARQRPTAADAPFLDARTTPVSTRAPVITVDPATLPDFALFRECESCPEMVVIPAGSFRMGSPADEPGRQEHEDTVAGRFGEQVNVNIPRFAISRFETTWSEWGACVTAGNCDQGPIDALEREQQWARDALGWGLGRRPVVLVDWSDAGAFAGWVNGRASTRAYRRPTEAEWEYAARAGTETLWSFGDTENQLGQYAWFSENANRRTQPVGGKGANPWGLYDMHGNVWEWVEDCYRDNLSGQTAAAHTTSGCSSRVLRGGSWGYSPGGLRSAVRGGLTSSDRYEGLGFRLARTL